MEKNELNTVKRGPKRALYDDAVIYDILDSTLTCHIGQQKNGQVFVTPNCHWRDGEYLYWHGHAKARNVAGAAQPEAQSVCINVCALDGLVLARSAFNHSLNYRSVTLFGTPEWIEDPDHKAEQLQRMVEKISPGRWSSLRPMTDTELAATGVVRIRIDNASAKIRTGDPGDAVEDGDWPVFAGVIPMERNWGNAELAENALSGFSAPVPPEAF